MLSLLLLLVQAQTPTPFPYGMPRTSFAEARAKVFANPVPEPFPLTGSLPESTVLASWGPVLKRFGKIVKDPADFRLPAPPKLVHRYGVCADAVWEIDSASNASGLFRQGTRVPALMRFSTATNRTVHLPLVPRIWSVAIKLFPSVDPKEAVVTRNLVLLDQYGVDGQARRHFLRPREDEPPLFFTNHVAASGVVAHLIRWVLDLYDRNPLYRSLAPLAEVDVVDGQPFSVRVPELIQLQPRINPRPTAVLPEDYREELRDFAPGELVFDVVLPSQPLSPQLTRIGTLTVGETVVSPVCDGALQFWHPPVPYGQHVPN